MSTWARAITRGIMLIMRECHLYAFLEVINEIDHSNLHKIIYVYFLTSIHFFIHRRIIVNLEGSAIAYQF